MGNYRFRFSDMIPNSWLHKLRDMSRTRPSSTHHRHLPTPIKKKQPPSSAAPTPPPLQDPPRHSQTRSRKSYHFARDLAPPSPPRKSTKQRRTRRPRRSSSPRLVASSVSAGCSCRATATLDSFWTKPDSVPECSTSPPPSHTSAASDSEELPASGPLPQLSPERCGGVVAHRSFDQMVSWSSSSCRCRVLDSAESTDRKPVKSSDGCKSVSTEIELPPILTKPVNFNDMVNNLKSRDTHEPTKSRTTSQLSVRVVKAEQITVQQEHNKAKRSFSVSSPGVKLRINSPRLASTKRAQTQSQSQSTHHGPGRKGVPSPSPQGGRGRGRRRRRSVSDSFAVMKSSLDPQRDFRDSMVEMIVENDIRASKDLEELLACYLSLNSDEYHDLIVNVFKQIWFDLNCTRLK